ncbi:glycoside hydrolase family 18 protein [Fibrella aquatilis]|uniref:chitinase n=1 Tax=Fibrella aquatilis TaxID=2817059 RepID=A0A939G9E1_9BACT|nr:glycoside hydrolase family 18 protein [Fibrella aquatilis]MBO0933059.1 glycoside hydrolase family 18 protein [Fibrella aquatilis]
MKNTHLAHLVALAGTLATQLPLSLSAQTTPKSPVIIGYVTGNGWTKDQIEVQKLTHINYAFAVPAANGKLAPLSANDSVNLANLTALRARKKDLRILLSIGGWGGCKYFSDVALTEASRKTFADDAVAMLKKHHLDGLDIDWEYPAQIGDNNIFRPQDKQTYTLLLKALRDQLDQQGRQNNRLKTNHYLLTSATGGDSAFVSHTELGKAQQYLDFVNIMTYDLYHGNDKVTGHHSPLGQSKKEKQGRNSSMSAVEGHIRAGVPASKIVLGLPFYGRGWTNVADKDNGLYQPAAGKHLFISHDELVDKYIDKNGFTRYWDADAGVPYLWNPMTHTFFTYEDEASLARKTAYAKAKGLAGVMFWEYTYDLKQKTLLNAVVQGL